MGGVGRQWFGVAILEKDVYGVGRGLVLKIGRHVRSYLRGGMLRGWQEISGHHVCVILHLGRTGSDFWEFF